MIIYFEFYAMYVPNGTVNTDGAYAMDIMECVVDVYGKKSQITKKRTLSKEEIANIRNIK